MKVFSISMKTFYDVNIAFMLIMVISCVTSIVIGNFYGNAIAVGRSCLYAAMCSLATCTITMVLEGVRALVSIRR